MRAVVSSRPGPADSLEIVSNVPLPTLQSGQVLIKIEAFGLNRADIGQRLGKYPAPPGAPQDILGLEASGTIAAHYNEEEQKSSTFKIGDKVMALLAGGGYAEYVAIDAGSVMKVPDCFNLTEAAAIPENFLTSYGLLFLQGNLKDGDTVVVYAAGSGIGVSVVQLAVQLVPNCKVIAIAGDDGKIKKSKELGAVAGFNYKTDPDWDQKVLEFTDNKGVNLVLDCVAGSFVDKTLNILGMESRWVLYGTLGGAVFSNFNAGILMRKRINVVPTTLRNRSLKFKSDLVNEFSSRALPALADGRIKLVIDRVFPLEEIVEAHRYMEQDKNTGKIIVSVGKAKTPSMN
jgi:tumor protein p53-inducible protein 3